MKNIIHFNNISSLKQRKEYVDVTLNGLSGDMILGSFMTEELCHERSDRELAQRILDKHSIVSYDLLSRLFTREYRQTAGVGIESVLDSIEQGLTDAPCASSPNKYDYWNLRGRQRRLIFMGQVIAGTQTEIRVPFYDDDLVRFAFSVPPRLRVREQVYIRMLCEQLPELMRIPWQKLAAPVGAPPWLSFLYQLPWKAADKFRWELARLSAGRVSLPLKKYGTDHASWMRADLCPFVENILCSERFKGRGYFEPAIVREIVKQHMTARADHSPMIGALITFELFHQLYLD
jgi:asparagine synthetase B (glutamine-hydrolysing)